MASSNLQAADAAAIQVGHLRGLKVLWLGPTSNGLGWLHARISSFRLSSLAVVEVSASTQGAIAGTSAEVAAQLRPLVEAGAERLIMACCNRLDYPQEAIEWLNVHAPELPLALATDTWWDGARRTGLGGRTHLTLPWHRWWDGWCDWLDATSGDWFGPCVQPATLGMERRRVAAGVGGRQGQEGTPSRGVVVANCRQTAEAWCMVARQTGGEAQWRSAAGWHEAIQLGADFETRHSPKRYSEIDWLLWDDSCLTTAGTADGLAQCLNFIEQARRAVPQARIFCACSLPRWADWEPMQRLGASELLTKPNTGRGLQRLLRNL